MIITLDGPSGVGKSTLSKKLAQELNFEFLDTGAMYRAVALLMKQHNYTLELNNLEEFLDSITIVFDGRKVIVNNQDITDMIRTPEIDLLSSAVGQDPRIRKHMCFLQRKAAEGKNMVVEGRDMGSHVFPNAELKFYLDANSTIRAERRRLQLKHKGIEKSLEELIQEIETRDFNDSHREHSPLCIPEGAIVIDTSNLFQDDVFSMLISKIKQFQKKII